METMLTSYADILKAAQDADIDEKKLEKAVEGNYLPPTTTFTHAVIKNPKTEFAHIRLKGTNGASVSVGSLIANVAPPKTAKEALEFKPSEKAELGGALFLVGQPVNKLDGNHARVCELLIGQTITAVQDERWFQQFKGTKAAPIYAKTKAKALEACKVRKFYVIDVLPKAE